MVLTAQIRKGNNTVNKGDLMAYLDMLQVVNILGVSRGALFKYVALGVLNAKIEETGNEHTGIKRELKFKPEEIERFKELIRKRRTHGQRLV